MNTTNPPMSIKSCEVRILERSFGEAWNSIRRMVISPSVAETAPQCIEFFVPLSKVQIRREGGSRQVLLKWSDTCQERSDRTDGNYNTLHSYVYDGSTPNIGVGLQFRTKQGAKDFEKAVLQLSFHRILLGHCPAVLVGYTMWLIRGREHKQYKAVVPFQSRSSWRYSNAYHLYRDTELDRKSTRLNSSHRSLSRMPSSA